MFTSNVYFITFRFFFSKQSYTTTNCPNCPGDSHYDLKFAYYGQKSEIFLDDFAVWYKQLADEDIMFVYKEGKSIRYCEVQNRQDEGIRLVLHVETQFSGEIPLHSLLVKGRPMVCMNIFPWVLTGSSQNILG